MYNTIPAGPSFSEISGMVYLTRSGNIQSISKELLTLRVADPRYGCTISKWDWTSELDKLHEGYQIRWPESLGGSWYSFPWVSTRALFEPRESPCIENSCNSPKYVQGQVSEPLPLDV